MPDGSAYVYVSLGVNGSVERSVGVSVYKRTKDVKVKEEARARTRAEKAKETKS